jgi:guanylate cyclase
MHRGPQVLSILQNITQGMDFLHCAQPPVLHGGLKAANVLIDRQFCAKISDFGLPSCRPGGGGAARYRDWTPYWTAPECLAGGHATVKSDVYAFGVVLYEILARRSPFEDSDEDPELIADALCRGARRLEAPDGCSAEMAALMDETLAFSAQARPPFSALYQRLSRLDARAVASAAIAPPETVDTPSRRQRRSSAFSTESAEAAHQGSLTVMRSLFPRHVGDALIRGEKVPPERKEAITMYFSDVVGFTDISSRLPAEKVSDMLDRLYVCLDELADRLGVYKVETIGDAYLCATNILSDQDDSHAAIMARFAVEAMRAAAATPVDPDDPSQGCVQIRIGLNSGPCMASVVGRKNPKYTLFGDTINVASRMESSSRPGRIQCTARTRELILAQDPGTVRLQRRGLISVKGKQAPPPPTPPPPPIPRAVARAMLPRCA